MAIFFMAAGGTGGHVIPAVAVARELRRRGHEAVFLGTQHGFEARLVPAEGFRIEWIRIGGLSRTGLTAGLRTLAQLPIAVWTAWRWMSKLRPAAVLSLGGYVAGPAVLAAILRGIPVVAMEPNAMPGMVTRRTARWARRALLSFEETARFFPAGRAEVTGVPVRPEFFTVPPKSGVEPFTVLITGGSQGSRTLNRAASECWTLIREKGLPVTIILQCGKADADLLRAELARSGAAGEVTPFLDDMAAAFARADLVICRAGAGTIAELAAAGRPAVLVPFPFAADDHQARNAEAMERAGAARMVRDREMTGMRLFDLISEFAGRPEDLRRMGEAARSLSRPDAARRAAAALEAAAGAG